MPPHPVFVCRRHAARQTAGVVLALALSSFLPAADVPAPAFIFTTLAGSAGGQGFADGPAARAQYASPIGVAVDAAGNIFVADSANAVIRRISAGGVVSTIAGLPGLTGDDDGTGTAARFRSPHGLALDGAGNLYVSDVDSFTIRKITPAGVVTTFAGSPGNPGAANGTGTAARFRGPRGLAVDAAGNVYVAEFEDHTIRRITPAGVVTTYAGSAGVRGFAEGPAAQARFDRPAALAFDSEGTLYVSDSLNSLVRKISPAGVVSTLAGGLRQYGYVNGTGGAARFNEPAGLVVTATGTVFLVDEENNCIRRITASGTVTTFAGNGGGDEPGFADGTGTAARFEFPLFLALDPSGNLIVPDVGNSLIRRVTPNAVVTTLSGLLDHKGGIDGIGDEAQFNSPRDLAVNAAGVIYVADSQNHTIRRIDPGGAVSTFAGAMGIPGAANGTGGAARFNQPFGLALDAAGNLYVADLANHAIRRITPAGVVTTVAGTPGEPGSTNGPVASARFSNPSDVAVDAAGNIYVADTSNRVIRRISAGGTVTTLAGSVGQVGIDDGTGEAARFAGPFGLTIDPAGNLYVTDLNRSTIRRVTSAGVVTTIAGSPGNEGSIDGLGSTARFNEPTWITIDASGNLFVADSSNNLLRRVTPGGIVTTIAGSPLFPGNADGPGTAARFSFPTGVAFDRAGTLYVVDGSNNSIRWASTALPVPSSPPTASGTVGQPFTYTAAFAGAVSGPYSANGLPPGLVFNATTGVISGVPTVPGVFGVELGATNGAGTGVATLNLTISGVTPAGEQYTITTLAGTLTAAGSTNGFGAGARFNRPTGVAVDARGVVIVADGLNRTIRAITRGGVVQTIAGMAGQSGTADGSVNEARFVGPQAVAMDSASNIYVADSGSHTIRKIVPGLSVSTLAGQPGVRGATNGPGDQARFDSPSGLAVDSNGNLWVADTANHVIRRITPNGTVSTFAGLAGTFGSTDGTRDVARFASPAGVVVDGAGNLFVADSGNRSIRKITAAGVVSTLAGTVVGPGLVDGTGTAARFVNPVSIALDRAGNLFVVDAGGPVLRKVTSAGVVTTIAGAAASGAANGTGSAARFDTATGIAVDPAGNLYVADTANHAVRWGALATPTLVSATTGAAALGQRFSYAARFSGTLVGPYTANPLPAGLAINQDTGVVSGTPTEAGTFPIVLGATNGAGTGNATFTLTVVGAPPTLAANPSGLNVSVGRSATLTVRAGGSQPLSYQWRRNGVPIPGATQASFTLPSAAAADAGSYTVTVSNSLGSITSAAAVVTVIPLSALSNLSVRTTLATGQVLIVGAVVTGNAKNIVLRAAGPALNQFGLNGLADPRLELFTGGVTPVAANEDWNDGLSSVFTALGAFPFSTGSRDAALLQPLSGSFTVQARGPGAGTVLVEAYDAAGGFLPRLVNVSARNRVGTGADVLIAGFVVSGTGTKQLLIRGIGPALTALGVAGALSDPRLQVFNRAGAVIATNDNWDPGLAATFTQAGAFPLPAGSRDAALLLTLAADESYTVQVEGVGGTTGEGLIEIYEVF